MNSLVSIIVPIYNRESYVDDIVKTVKNQTYKNWELIFVDDCSIDNTAEKIENMKLDNIKLIKSTKNSGVAIARNKGIEMARGKYIAFLDSDDLWDKEKLFKQVQFMEKNNYKFSFTGYQYKNLTKQGKIVKVPEKLNYKQAMKNTVIFTSTVVLNAELLGKEIMMMPNVAFGEDSITWWKILKKGNTAYGINENLATYRRIDEKSLARNKLFTIENTWKSYRKYEGLSICESMYFFMFYLFNAIKRRI